jgi:hypothetical protein
VHGKLPPRNEIIAIIVAGVVLALVLIALGQILGSP